MPEHKIANYRTVVPANRSIQEIGDMLVAHGATKLLMDYEENQPVALSFIIGTPYGEMPFRLPANVEKVRAVLVRQRVRSKVDNEYAARVAWRILKDWIRAQMAILETEMVTVDQIFLPYMQGKDGKILYELMVERHLELPEGTE